MTWIKLNKVTVSRKEPFISFIFVLAYYGKDFSVEHLKTSLRREWFRGYERVLISEGTLFFFALESWHDFAKKHIFVHIFVEVVPLYNRARFILALEKPI